jgi:hypothetical protein
MGFETMGGMKVSALNGVYVVSKEKRKLKASRGKLEDIAVPSLQASRFSPMRYRIVSSGDGIPGHASSMAASNARFSRIGIVVTTPCAG